MCGAYPVLGVTPGSDQKSIKILITREPKHTFVPPLDFMNVRDVIQLAASLFIIVPLLYSKMDKCKLQTSVFAEIDDTGVG